MGPKFGAHRFGDLATCSETVDRVVAAENLKALASTVSEPEVVLGLACLARAGSPLRSEMSEIAVRERSDYGPVAAVLALTMDGVDESSIGGVIERDPDNALGYYVQANLLYERNKEDKAMEAFRKGAHCSELRLYEPITGPAIFEAADALKMQGRDRLCALSWMACRSSNFSSSVMQFLNAPLADWSRCANGGAKQELSDLMLALGGHLFGTNFYNRWAAKQALEHAVFGLNAKVPERLAATPGAGSVTQKLLSTMLRWPGTTVEEPSDQPYQRLRLAQFLPDMIHRAFAALDGRHGGKFGEANVQGSRKAAFESARANFLNSARTLIDLALANIDGVMAPYLNGISPKGVAGGRRVVAFETDVERLLRERPELFAVAATNRAAMDAMWDAEAGDPSRRNITRMMEINQAIHRYASTHDDTYPESIEVLFREGYLKAPTTAKSILTGKPYVYVAAGEKVPEKSKDKWPFVVMYDDNPDQWGCYPCVFAAWVGGSIRPEHLKEQLEKRRIR